MIPAARTEKMHTAILTTCNQSTLGFLRGTAVGAPCWEQR